MEENQVIEAQETQEISQEPTQQRTDYAKNNLIALRKKLEQEEEARKQAERRAEEAERRYEGRTQQVAPPNDDDDFIADPDDYLQAKQFIPHSKKIKSKQKEHDDEIKNLKERLAIFEAKTEIDQIKDFNEVVNTENLKTLARLYPEDYEVMNTHNDLRKKAKSAYNMIKRYGIIDYQVDQAEERMEKNKKKPGNAGTAAPQQPQTPLSRLGDYERRVLTESDRDRILRRVEEMKSRG